VDSFIDARRAIEGIPGAKKEGELDTREVQVIRLVRESGANLSSVASPAAAGTIMHVAKPSFRDAPIGVDIKPSKARCIDHPLPFDVEVHQI